MTDALIQNVNPFTAYAHEVQEVVKKNDMRLKEQVIAVFSTPHGMQLLETLDELFTRRPVCPAGSPEGYGYMREGQNSLVAKFRNIIAASQQG